MPIARSIILLVFVLSSFRAKSGESAVVYPAIKVKT